MKNPMKFYAIMTLIMVVALIAIILFVPKKVIMEDGSEGKVSLFNRNNDDVQPATSTTAA